MGVPATKAELLAAIEKTFAQLSADLDRVPAGGARDRTLEGHVRGGMMSAADLVAYLVAWNQQVLIWHRRRVEGLPDEFPAAGIGWNELGLFAQRAYAAHESDAWDALRAQLVEAKDGVVALVEDCDDAQLYGAPWYGRWSLGRMISLNTSSPYANARRRIRAWLRTEPGIVAEVTGGASDAAGG